MQSKNSHSNSNQIEVGETVIEYMSVPTKFKFEIKTVPFGNGTMKIKNLTPILTQEERDKRNQEIEAKLYDVFSKYTNKSGKH